MLEIMVVFFSILIPAAFMVGHEIGHSRGRNAGVNSYERWLLLPKVERGTATQEECKRFAQLTELGR